MKRINTMRAKFLYERFGEDGMLNNTYSMIEKLFDSEPSATDTIECKGCGDNRTETFESLGIDHLTFADDMNNLETALSKTNPGEGTCWLCYDDANCSREYGPHLFINLLTIFDLSEGADPKLKVKHKLADIPISLFNNQYQLVAAFLLEPGVSDEDTGHYKVAIKLNEKFEIYDNYKSKAQEVPSKHQAVVTGLFYVKNDCLDEREGNPVATEQSQKRKSSPKEKRSAKRRKEF